MVHQVVASELARSRTPKKRVVDAGGYVGDLHADRLPTFMASAWRFSYCAWDSVSRNRLEGV